MGLLSASLIGQFEGYRDNPYWDVNAYRAGFGSDTTTLADGSVVPIRQGMTVNREDSLRDLNRRIGSEFRPSVVRAVGQDAYSRLSEPQRAVLDSLAYNYGAGAWGKGLRGVASAVQTPGTEDDVKAIRALSSHNDGVNAKRRAKEADIYGGGNVGVTVNSFLPSGNGGTQMQGLLSAFQKPEDTRSIGERLRDGAKDGSLWDALAVGFNSMRGSFADPNISAMAQSRMDRRQEQEQVNQTAEWLRQNGREDLAAAIEGGMIDGSQAFGMMQPAKDQALVNAGDGRIYDPNSGEWIMAPGSGQPELPDSVMALKWRAQEAGLQPGTPEYAQFMVEGGRNNGLAIDVDPATGAVSFRQGAGAGSSAKPFTEPQSKDNVYATRAEGALATLDPLAGELTSLGQRAAGADPTGVIRGRVQTDQFQIAKVAADEFLQAILRKDTGAAITAQEQELYGKTYLPQPGDSEAAMSQKAQARRRAVEALKAGMSPAQIVAQERGLQASGSEQLPPIEAPQPEPAGLPDFSGMSDQELSDWIAKNGG